MLARVLSEGKEQHDEAEKLYKKGLEIAPDYFELLYSYGSFCMDFRDDETTAAECYRKAMWLDPVMRPCIEAAEREELEGTNNDDPTPDQNSIQL
mmetsp:Transcript_43508/g.137618  ORF Transcript_43508/g.137618 Transcript_43508/m.137618 type:complete len:95 (-) Transcript_43508:657-941(-)